MSFSPPNPNFMRIKTIDMHTGGEPVRIILDGFPKFPNKPILEIRQELKTKYDHVRKLLMWEPRGHVDMYGILKVAREREDSDFGVIFMHNAGYSTMCGHATIAIAKAGVEMGWVVSSPPLTRIKIDAPCGQITAFVHHHKDQITHVSFENVASFYIGKYTVAIPGTGSIEYDLAYGGAFYAYLNIKQLGIHCSKENYAEIIRFGKIIKKHILESNPDIWHPFESDLSFLYGTIFIEESKKPGIHSRNVCVFADGEVDRCATGSGISGRAAIHFYKKELKMGETIQIESIIGSQLSVSVVREEKFGPYKGIIPVVTGNAYFTGMHEFWVDPEDPLKEGFLLR